jgi:protein ImuB
MRRILSLWLPSLSTDRLSRRGAAYAAWADKPLVTVAAMSGGLRVAAANGAALAAGVQVSQTVADARALIPALKVAPASPDNDLACLERLAEWCGRWTPWTAPDGLDPDGGAGIWLDVSGCAHLFGGEQGLLDDVIEHLRRLGFAACAGLADTPGAAWAVARFGREGDAASALVPEGAIRQLLTSLPVAALRLPAAVLDILHRLGLTRIGDLMALPRGPLATRFGEGVARRLDQLLGVVGEPISPSRPAAAFHARLAFAEPIGRTADVGTALDHLLEELCRLLQRARLGARRLELTCYRVDGTVLRLAVGTAQPVRDPRHLARLFARDLDGLDAGFGIEAMALVAPVTEEQGASQLDLSDRRGDEVPADLGLLVDRLGLRLGPGSVVGLVPQASHVPERAVRAEPPFAGRRGGPSSSPVPPWPVPPRPTRLLSRPERVEAQATSGPPLSFRWRNEAVRVARAEGPERICAEWWHAATPPPPSALRDYWRIEDAAGRRFWLFREGAGWFVHGIFA